MLGGVCGAIGRRIGRDPTIVRVAFVVFALIGFGVALYVLAWLFAPLDSEPGNIASRAVADPRGLAMAAGLVALVGLGLLVVSALGVSFIGSASASVLVAVGGLLLIWRNASPAEQPLLRRVLQPIVGLVSPSTPSHRSVAIRCGLAAAMVGTGFVALVRHQRFHEALRPLGGLVLVVAAIVIVLGPWWLRIARDLVAERQARARAEEREEMACRVHDSVLQTLALIQRRADSPSDVVRLARAQERELRGWLFEGRATPAASGSDDDTTFSAGIRRIQEEVEASHGIPVEAVVVGDCLLDDHVRSFLAAGREATVNAAKWSGSSVISVFAEVDETGLSMFVRDTGVGFEPDLVPEDRRGLSDSINGRMARLGGNVRVRTALGEGTEVAITLPLARQPGSRQQ